MLSKRFDVDCVVKNPKCFGSLFDDRLEKPTLGTNLNISAYLSNIKFGNAE